MRQSNPFSALCDRVTRPVGRKEFLVWCALALALLTFHLALLGPNLEPDSYQYLSVAGNFTQGKPGYTSIAHFDTERSHGTVPAPMTTFPSGYSAAIAALGTAGLTPERAGVAISAVALLSLLLLYRTIAEAMGIGGLGTRVAFLFTFANAELLLFSRTVASEGLFTLLTVGALLLFAAGVSPSLRREWRWSLLLAANVLVGCAYWVRYAGLFLFAAMFVTVALLLLRRGQAALPAAGSLLVSAALILAGFLRNQLLVGTWKGGNEKVVNHPLLGVAARSPVELYHLFSGRIGSAHYGWLDVLLALAAVTVVGLCAWALARNRGRLSPAMATVLGVLSIYLSVYWAAMVYAGHASVITFGARMFLPLLPVILVVFAGVITLAQTQLGASRQGESLVAAVLVLACAYVAANVRSITSQPRALAQHQRVQAALAEEIAPGRTLAAWIAATIPPGQVIVATHGQATGYVLKRPTVSLVPLRFSTQHWGEQEVRSVMQRYHASYLILYPGDDPEVFESPFLEGLLTGTRPAWLAPAAMATDMKVFRFQLIP